MHNNDKIRKKGALGLGAFGILNKINQDVKKVKEKAESASNKADSLKTNVSLDSDSPETFRSEDKSIHGGSQFLKTNTSNEDGAFKSLKTESSLDTEFPKTISSNEKDLSHETQTLKTEESHKTILSHKISEDAPPKTSSSYETKVSQENMSASSDENVLASESIKAAVFGLVETQKLEGHLMALPPQIESIESFGAFKQHSDAAAEMVLNSRQDFKEPPKTISSKELNVPLGSPYSLEATPKTVATKSQPPYGTDLSYETSLSVDDSASSYSPLVDAPRTTLSQKSAQVHLPETSSASLSLEKEQASYHKTTLSYEFKSPKTIQSQDEDLIRPPKTSVEHVPRANFGSFQFDESIEFKIWSASISEQKLLSFLVKKCSERLSEITGPIVTDQIIQETELSYHNIKKSYQRLKAKGILDVHSFMGSNKGWTSYILNKQALNICNRIDLEKVIATKQNKPAKVRNTQAAYRVSKDQIRKDSVGWLTQLDFSRAGFSLSEINPSVRKEIEASWLDPQTTQFFIDRFMNWAADQKNQQIKSLTATFVAVIRDYILLKDSAVLKYPSQQELELELKRAEELRQRREALETIRMEREKLRLQEMDQEYENWFTSASVEEKEALLKVNSFYVSHENERYKLALKNEWQKKLGLQ